LPNNKHPIRGYLFIASATMCWAISATLGRAVFTGRLLGNGGKALPPIDPLILAQSRTTISFLILAPMLLLFRGRSALSLPKRDWVWTATVGVLGVAMSNYFYYLAIQKTNVATAITLQYTAPIWVLLYMVARGVQMPTMKRLISIALAILGIAIVVGLFSSGGFRVNAGGVMAAQIAAVTFAFYNVGGSRLVARYDRWKVVANTFLGAALFWIVVNPPWKIIAAHYSPAQWLFLLMFAMTSILLPFSLYFAGLQHLDPTRAIVTSCLEPVFSILVAGAVLGEIVGPMQVLGIAMVLAATVLVQMPDQREKGLLVEPME
jgi:drug/metabolite transporter (DMT)-like permease